METEQKNARGKFSKKAIDKAIIKSTTRHPSVLYPAAVGVLGGLAAILIEPSLLLLGVAGVGIGLSALGWSINFGLRKEKFANNYVQEIHDAMETKRREKSDNLEKSLRDIGSRDGADQFLRVKEKFETLSMMLDTKLNQGELTHSRYLGMAEKLYLATLDNLDNVVNTLRSIQSIDVGFITKKIDKMRKAPDRYEAREVDALTKRKSLYEEQKDKVQKLLTINEEAMTQLDLTVAAIADMKTKKGQATIDIDTAMNELEKLATRAQKYSF